MKHHLFSEEDKALFIEGFCDAAPSWYNVEEDGATPAPWCAPWTWTRQAFWYDSTLSPYEMGKEWARLMLEEMEEAREKEDF